MFIMLSVRIGSTEVLSMKTLEMIVPCFNEQEAIRPFYEKTKEVFSAMDDTGCSLIFIDDGSTDGTLAEIKALSELDDSVRYISFSRNFGKEGAMLAGLTYSTADYVGIIDADLQHNPKLIPEMLKAVTDEGFDVAASKRSGRNGEGPLKRVLSAGFYKLSNSVTDIEIDEGAQDYRIMKRKVVEAILSLSEKNRFTKGIFSFVGFKTKWFEHENESRVSGKSKWTIRKLFRYALNGILSFTTAPLKIPGRLGVLLMIVSFVFGVLLYIEPSWIHFTFLRGVTAIVGFMTGLILVCLGIACEYLAKMFEEIKNRPAFIISETNIKDDGKGDL